MKQKISLSVPFRERQRAKNLGAYWDPIQVRWYITSDMDPVPFQRWIKSQRSARVHIRQAYVMNRIVPCSRCQSKTTVYCLGTRELITSPRQEEHVGFFTLFHITTLPRLFCRELHHRYLTYYMTHTHHSHTRLQNHCLCGVTIDDRVLHRPGPNSFRPLNEQQAAPIKCELLSHPIKGLIQCQWRANPLLLSHLIH